jgi:FkbM family methyltransferase
VVRGIPIRMRCTNALEQWRLDSFESKEPDLLDWIEDVCSPGDTFYDIGANIGQYALFAALRQPDTAVVAFEPAPPNLARLAENVIANGVSNVRVSGVALSDRCGPEWLRLSGCEGGASMHSTSGLESMESFGESPVIAIVIYASTLDAVVKTMALPEPAVLKIDVDGSEMGVLDGAGETLRSSRLRHLMVECNWTDATADRPELLDRYPKTRGFARVGSGARFRRHLMHWQNLYFQRTK